MTLTARTVALIGVGLVLYGLSLWSVPLALVLGGAWLVVGGSAVADKSKRG